MEEEEAWAIIPRSEGNYEASNLGRVRSLLCGKEKILKSQISRGYLYTSISRYGKRKKYGIHVLVAMAFLNHSPCNDDLVVDHINGNRFDNRSENLRIVTNRFNVTEGHRKKNSNVSSKYTGVSACKTKGKWRAGTRINGVDKNLGIFDSEIDAANRYIDYLNNNK